MTLTQSRYLIDVMTRRLASVSHAIGGLVSANLTGRAKEKHDELRMEVIHDDDGNMWAACFLIIVKPPKGNLQSINLTSLVR